MTIADDAAVTGDAIAIISAVVSLVATVAAWRAAKAAKESVAVTEALADGAADTAKRQLRAYIGVDSVRLHSPNNLHSPSYTPSRGMPGRLMEDRTIMTLRNFGDTPANRVQVTSNHYRISPMSKPEDDLNMDEEINKEIRRRDSHSFFPTPTVSPGQTIESDLQIADLTDFRRAVAGEDLALYVYGRVDYVDIYGDSHATRFCYFYDPTRPEGKQFVPYEQYNEAT